MINAVTNLTRRCPRGCRYCAIRDEKSVGPELTPEQWKKAFSILKEIGVDFNLILGNETWLLGDDLIEIMRHNEVPYALYTTCPEPLFSKYRDRMFQVVDNLSCGVDWPLSYLDNKELHDDTEKKSLDAWRGFQWVKENFPEVDCHASITIHRKNVKYLQETINELSALGVFSVVNFLHWDKDGEFDFFPPEEELVGLMIPQTPRVLYALQGLFDDIMKAPGLLQNPEMLALPASKLLSMKWHCKGDPYGGPTIDSDGSLRVCGYRKGQSTPKFSIFDLPDQLEEWKKAVRSDAWLCPGCSWPCPWMYHYWKDKDEEMGKKVFLQHAGENIPKEKWSKRRQTFKRTAPRKLGGK